MGRTGWRPLHRADGNVRSGRGCRSGGPRSGRFLRLVALGTHFLVKNAVSLSQVTPADLRSLRCDPCVAATSDGRSHGAQGAILVAALGGSAQHALCSCAAAAMARLVPRPCSVSLDQTDQLHRAACLGVSRTSARSAPPPSAPRSGAFRWFSQGRPWERFP